MKVIPHVPPPSASMDASNRRCGMKATLFAASMAVLAVAVSGFHSSPLVGGLSRSGSSFFPSASIKRAGLSSASPFGGRSVTFSRRRSGSGVTGLKAQADYYASLGINRGADQDEIKKAFRAKARKVHPDVNKSPNAIKEFQEIQQAYEVLSDPQKKGLYDQFGEAGVKSGGGFGGGGAGFQDFGDFSPFGDIFDTFFGGGGGGGRARKPQGPQQGDDLRLDLEIDFIKAIFGGDEKIKISHLETCDTCEVRCIPPPAPFFSLPRSRAQRTRIRPHKPAAPIAQPRCTPLPRLLLPELTRCDACPEWQRDEAWDEAEDLWDVRGLRRSYSDRAHPPRDAAAAERVPAMPGHGTDRG